MESERPCPTCGQFSNTAKDARIAQLEAENNAFLIHTDGSLPAYAKAFARIKRRVLDGVMSLPQDDATIENKNGGGQDYTFTAQKCIRVSDIEALWEAGDEKALREAQEDG